MSAVMLGSGVAMKKIVGKQFSINVFTLLCDQDFLRKSVGTWIKECF